MAESTYGIVPIAPEVLRPREKGESNAFTIYHPDVLALKGALKSKRDRASDSVISVARIPLLFAVQTHFEEKANLFFK